MMAERDQSPGEAKRRRLWFEEDDLLRASIASAYDDVPLRRLSIARLEGLALSRHFGLYETVGDLLRADAKIRHVRNLGRLGLERLDAVVRPLIDHGPIPPEQAYAVMARLCARVPGIDALGEDDYDYLPWHDTDPAVRALAAERYAEMPLGAWDLSNRARNALKVAGVETVSEVLVASSEIQSARGIGRKTLCELHARSVLTLRGEDLAAERWRRAQKS